MLPWTTERLPKLVWTKRGRERSYQLTEADVFKLAQAAQHEGRPTRAVIWTLIQRFAWIYPAKRTLKGLVEAYSQPINPGWLPGGSLLNRELNRIRRSARYTETQKARMIRDHERRARRRTQFARETWTNISPTIRRAVEKVLKGEDTTPLSGSVHFRASVAARNDSSAEAWEKTVEWASRRTRRVGRPLRANWGYKPGVNVFFLSPGNTSEGFTISVGPPDPKGSRPCGCLLCPQHSGG
jgi:hypothetical protein